MGPIGNASFSPFPNLPNPPTGLPDLNGLPQQAYMRPARQADKYAWVARVMHTGVKMLRVSDINEYYYQEEDNVYYRMSDEMLLEYVRDIWLGAYGVFTPKELHDTMEVVKIMTMDKVPTLNSNNIMVCKGLFWRKRFGELDTTPDGPTFYKLFDTDHADRHTIRVANFTEEQKQTLLETYEDTKKQLEQGIYPCPYEFIKVWANNQKETEIDIMRMLAYCFIKKKPLGSGVLIGLRRNGKTTFVDMLHTIFGNKNTSRVQLSQLGDPHYTHTLRRTLLNAPDEEEDSVIQYQGMFKTMSDHGVLVLPVMRSNTPVRVACDFMSFFPMNHLPEWKGTGASACVSRSLIIPFENDLKRYDRVSKNFCEQTYTAETFCHLLGTVFGYAWYYHRHDHEFSDRMLIEQAYIQEDLDSAVTYKKEFEEFFDGFENLKLVYDDYQFWCKSRDVRISTYKQFRFVFRPYLNTRGKVRVGDKRVSVYRIVDRSKGGRDVMMERTYRGDLGTSVATLHERNASMVEQLQATYAKELASLKSKKEQVTLDELIS